MYTKFNARTCNDSIKTKDTSGFYMRTHAHVHELSQKREAVYRGRVIIKGEIRAAQRRITARPGKRTRHRHDRCQRGHRHPVRCHPPTYSLAGGTLLPPHSAYLCRVLQCKCILQLCTRCREGYRIKSEGFQIVSGMLAVSPINGSGVCAHWLITWVSTLYPNSAVCVHSPCNSVQPIVRAMVCGVTDHSQSSCGVGAVLVFRACGGSLRLHNN